MNSVQVDNLIKEANLVTNGDKYNRHFRLYDQTNEELSEIFKHYEIKNKDVLTVLASSDQYFSCKYLDASKVDAFDRVYISLFYYYLRKWNLEKNHRFYLSFHTFYDGDYDLYQIVKEVKPKSENEQNAKTFWLNYLENNNYQLKSTLCQQTSAFRKKPYDLSNEKDIENIINDEISFTWMNMFYPINKKEKYDIIILSNLLEYAKSQKDLINVRNNIEKLLKDGGIAICSYKIFREHYNEHKNEVKLMTKNDLTVGDSIRYYEPLYGKQTDLAYSYQRKRK